MKSESLKDAQKRLRDYPAFSENPFIEKVKIKKGSKTVALGSSNQMVTNDGEVLPTRARMVIRTEVDKTKFIKLFSENVPFVLDGIALKLFIYLLLKCPFNQTEVFFNPKEWMDEDQKDKGLYYSSRTVYACLRELLDNEIIARSTSGNGFYHINPVVGFKGNRLDLFT